MKRKPLVLLGLGALLLGSIGPMSRPADAQTVDCTGIAAWSPNSVYYAVGALVTYNGSEYKCLQAHTSQAGWDPADVPALWGLHGTCGASTTGGTCSASPSAPTGLAASGTTSSGTTLSWSAVTPPANCSITSYTVYKNGTAIGTSTSTSFIVTALAAGTSYTFTVAATDSFGTGAQSSSISVTTSSASCTTVPSAPSGLAASNTSSSGTTLTWNAVSAPANCSISSYTIYEGGASIGTATGTSFSVTGLAASTTYSFTVAASDAAGTGSQSASISVTTGSGSTTSCWPAWNSATAYNGGAQVSYNGENYQAAYWTQGDEPDTHNGPAGSGAQWIPEGACGSGGSCTSTPSAPSGLAASNTTQTGTTLSWNAVTAPTNCSISSYTVYKGGTSIGTATGTTFTVSGLTASTTYLFTVAATDSAGTGSQSASISVTTQAAVSCTTVPSAPSGLTASGTTSSSTTLSWNAVSAPANCTISSYTVYNGSSAVATVSSGTSYMVTGLSASTTYFFTVAASDGAGTGAKSASVSVTTSASTGGKKHILAGYWDNWGGGVPYIPLNQVNSNWDIILVAFGIPANNQTGPDIEFSPTNETQAQIISDINQDHANGQKVILSLGGGNANISLNTSADINTFVTDVSNILTTYPFDGIDIDFENNCLYLNQGDTNLKNPTTPVVVNLISALNQLHAKFPNMMLTFAPETFFVQLGYQSYGPGPSNAQDNRSGCQLPVIDATRSWLSYVWTQEYQSGPIEALDNVSYNMGTPDFLTSMTEMLLRGFNVANGAGTFAPLAQNQVAVGVGANGNAVNGFIPDAQVKQAINYLTQGTSFGGSYKLQGGPYPNLGGIMAWSLSWDNENGNVFCTDMGPYIHGLP